MLVSLSVKNKLLSLYFFMVQEEMQCLNCVSHVSWNLKLPFHVLDVISEFLVSNREDAGK